MHGLFRTDEKDGGCQMDGSKTIALGGAIRAEWPLDWSKLTVNHGAYGATPKCVLAAQEMWRDRMEAQPSIFMRSILPDVLRTNAGALGSFLNADAQDIVFVDNATTGCNAVLRSLDFKPGDEIVLHGQIYGAVGKTARYVAGRTGASIVEVPLAFPGGDAAAFIEALGARLNDRTRLVIVDHITSPSALVLPVEAAVRLCRDAGVPILIDGAHGPGQIEVDLKAIDADWYVGNCHKWLAAPKGCAFLWSRRDRQVGLHPTTISHGFQQGYLSEFDWTGTRDATAFLAIETALAFHEKLGGMALRRRNADLAHQAGRLLADHFGTAYGNEAHPVAMAMVRLPFSGATSAERALALRDRLLDEFRCDAPLIAHPDGIWVRVSAHAYNEIGDYERLAGILDRLIRTDRAAD
ncbi:aminotransferase class V [Labrys miyagiensis]|uniref:Aminotransferase class V n=2 Tax=Labrys miyagiensis TaxID=346912 RepID=A0ABQ6CDU5_9HYPH|nr:aminotransferase class V [Labrys miyagiensis]